MFQVLMRYYLKLAYLEHTVKNIRSVLFYMKYGYLVRVRLGEDPAVLAEGRRRRIEAELDIGQI